MDEPRRRNIQHPILEHGKVPPNVTELERAVLGACMLDPDCIQDVIDILTPESFYRIEHQKIFQAILELSTKDNPVDILTVSNFLKQDGSLEMVGGLYFVSQLTDNIASGANAEFHARVIQQKFIQREIIRISGESYSNAYEDTADPIDLLESLHSQLTEISSAISQEGGKSMSELALELIEKSEAAAKGEIVGLKTGLIDVDKLTGGYKEAYFIVLAARSGMGKTSKALQEAYEFGIKQNRRTLFISVEMTSIQLMFRLVSLHTGIPAWKIREGKLDENEWHNINVSMKDIVNGNLTLVDNCTDLHSIRNRIVSEKRKNGLEIAYVDYLQRVKYTGKNKGTREQEVAEISTTLANTAKQLNTPIVALAQLGRGVETRGGSKIPQMSDLRESGQIEMDAHIIAFLYRPEYYGFETDDKYGHTEGLTQYIVAKNRDGQIGDAPMKFNKETTSFSNWEEKTWSAPSSEGIPDTYRSPMPKSQEFGDIDSLTEDILGDDDVF